MVLGVMLSMVWSSRDGTFGLVDIVVGGVVGVSLGGLTRSRWRFQHR